MCTDKNEDEIDTRGLYLSPVRVFVIINTHLDRRRVRKNTDNIIYFIRSFFL